jgi:hypothetical protein
MLNISEIMGRSNRRTVRSEPNPLDKATIVSIFPLQIVERKCTIQPGLFIIEPGNLDSPSTLTVGPSSWWREIDDQQPLLEIPESAVKVADSVIRDWAVGLLGCDMQDKMPGLFYVLGEVSAEKIKSEYKKELTLASLRQKNWFHHLVKMGDSLWARSNGNPLAVDDLMKLAATHLGLEKDWTKDITMVPMERCNACGALVNPLFPVCANCKAIINPELAAKSNIKFARQ